MWIDIKVREPKENERVFVCFEKHGEYNPCIAKCHYVTGYGIYWTYEPNFITYENPTFWMPLPTVFDPYVIT
jgi:hypothetical protein